MKFGPNNIFFSVYAAAQQTSEETPKKEDSFEAELCKDKDAGEWFRLVAGEGDNCRDVIQCTSSVSSFATKHLENIQTE